MGEWTAPVSPVVLCKDVTILVAAIERVFAMAYLQFRLGSDQSEPESRSLVEPEAAIDKEQSSPSGRLWYSDGKTRLYFDRVDLAAIGPCLLHDGGAIESTSQATRPLD
jgi:hypothetical protein